MPVPGLQGLLSTVKSWGIGKLALSVCLDCHKGIQINYCGRSPGLSVKSSGQEFKSHIHRHQKLQWSKNASVRSNNNSQSRFPLRGWFSTDPGMHTHTNKNDLSSGRTRAPLGGPELLSSVSQQTASVDRDEPWSITAASMIAVARKHSKNTYMNSLCTQCKAEEPIHSSIMQFNHTLRFC